MIVRIVAGSAEITRGIGTALGKVAEGPLAFLLVGDYGTGKTTLVQGIAAGLGVSEVVRSPSYNILKRYDSGRLILVHADLYRTQSDPDIEELGIMDILSAKGILAVEWPGRYLPPAKEMPCVSVNLSYPAGQKVSGGTLETRRNLEFCCGDGCPERVMEVLSALAAR